MASFEVGGEYATVDVVLDEAANGPRLRLHDVRGGRTRWLDPLQLEGLVWAPDHLLEAVLDPSRTRWSESAATERVPGVRQLVERLYPALAAGDEATLVDVVAEGFVGVLADGFPEPIGGRHEGRRAMIDDGWWAIGRRFAVRAEPDGWYDLGADRLLVTGRYRGRHRRGEQAVDAAFTHLWSAGAGHLTGLRQVTDTVAWGLPA